MQEQGPTNDTHGSKSPTAPQDLSSDLEQPSHLTALETANFPLMRLARHGFSAENQETPKVADAIDGSSSSMLGFAQ